MLSQVLTGREDYSYCVINFCAVSSVHLERRNTGIAAGF